MRPAPLRKIALIVIAAVGLLVLSTAGNIYFYGERSDSVRADAAIVLGAAAWGRKPSPVLRERVNHAVRLYRQQLVRKIIFTGGTRLATDPAESRVSRSYAIEQGIPPSDILIEERSSSTLENLTFASAVAAQNNLSTFLLVSDPLHMKRAMMLAEDLGMLVHSSPTTTSMFRGVSARARFLAKETYFYLRYRLLHR